MKTDFEHISQMQSDALISHLKQTGLAKDVVIDKTAFSKAFNSGSKTMTTSHGKVYGFVTEDGVIYLDPSRMNANTPFHEFGHLWNKFVQKNNTKLWKRIKEVTKQTTYYQQLLDDPFYKKFSEDNLVDEAFACAVGDNGERVINSNADKSFKNLFTDLLQNFWSWIGECFGIRQLSTKKIRALTFGQIVHGATADLLGGEPNIQHSTFVESKNYLDKLPLTLSVFETPDFMALQGKKVKPITIENLLNKKGVKAVERQLITDVLNETYKNQPSFNYDDFEAAVRVNIVPLQKIQSDSYAKYGLSNLGNEAENNIVDHQTVVLNFPNVAHEETGHFSGVYSSEYKCINYIPKQLGDKTWVAIDEKYVSEATQENIEKFVATAGSKEAVEKWIERYNAPNSKELYNNGMFGHFRAWKDHDGDFYISELQSDYFQKNAAKKDIIKNTREYSDAYVEYLDKKRKNTEEAIEEVYDLLTTDRRFEVKIYNSRFAGEPDYKLNLTFNGREIRNTADMNVIHEDRPPKVSAAIRLLSEINNGIPIEYKSETKFAGELIDSDLRNVIDEIKKISSEQNKKDKQANNDFEKQKEEIYQNLSTEEKQFIASSKTWERRLLHEAVRYAVENGAEKVYFPTPYTLAIIEGYVSNDGENMPYEIINDRGYYDGILRTGNIIEYVCQRYIVTESGGVMDEGFTALPLYDVSVDTTKKVWAKDNALRVMGDVVHEMRWLDRSAITREELEGNSNIDHLVKEFLLGKIEEKEDDIVAEMGTEDQDALDEAIDNVSVSFDEHYHEILENIEDEIYHKLDEDYFKDELEYKEAFVYGNEIYLWSKKPHGEHFEHPDYYEDKTSKEGFDTEDLSDTQQRVLEKYEQYGEQLRQDFGDKNIRFFEDSSGFDWYELRIGGCNLRPIVAFHRELNSQNLLIAEKPNQIDDQVYFSKTPAQQKLNTLQALKSQETYTHQDSIQKILTQEILPQPIRKKGRGI